MKYSKIFKSISLSLIAAILCFSADDASGQDTETGIDYPLAQGIVKGDNLNVRGRPSFAGIPMGKLKKGEKVEIYEVYNRIMAKEGEPSKWLKIKLPSQIPVWISKNYFESETNQITADELNFRSGPGFEYGILGTLSKGDKVSPLEISGDWVKLRGPENGRAFVAADYVEFTLKGDSATDNISELSQSVTGAATDAKTLHEGSSSINEPSAVIIENTIKVVASKEPSADQSDQSGEGGASDTEVLNIAEGESEDINITDVVSIPQTPAEVEVSENELDIISVEPASPSLLLDDDISKDRSAQISSITKTEYSDNKSEAGSSLPEKASAKKLNTTATEAIKPASPNYFEAYNLNNARSVIREGLVKGTLSARAPTAQALVSSRNKRVMNFLWAPKYQKGLRKLIGRRVIIQGREILDRRWPKTPVLYIEKIRLYPN